MNKSPKDAGFKEILSLWRGGSPVPVEHVNSPVCCVFVFAQRTDPQLLAQFYYADEELNQVATELDSLDGRKDPQRCTLLVNQFRSCQVRFLSLELQFCSV